MSYFERGFLNKMAAVTGSTLLGAVRGLKSGLRGVEKAKSMQTTVARATPPPLPTPKPVHVQNNLSPKLPDQKTQKMNIPKPKPIMQTGNGVASVGI